jgi:integrase/recombinase XerD
MSTIGDRMRQDLALAGYAKHTQEVYWSAARRFVGFFRRCATTLGREELREYVEHLNSQGLSASRLKDHYAALTFLYRKTLGRPDEVSFLSWPRQRSPLPTVLSPEEVARLLEKLQTPRYRAIAMVMYGAGLRISEATALEVGDIDAARGVLRVRCGKGGKGREVMLSPKLLSALRAYWRQERPPLPYLFVSPRTGRPLREEAVRVALRLARTEAGIDKHVSNHVLRHSFATHLLDQGTELAVIQAVLGHASIRSTTRYARVTTSKIVGTVSPLDRLPPGGTRTG